MPLVERKKLEQVLEYQSNLYHPSFSISGCDFYTNQFEFEKDQSLLFTLQALCLQQMGHRDVSTQLYLQGKQLLGKYFDDIDSISVLLSMKFTSLYLLGEGERRKARAMMLIVKAGIDPYLLKNEKVKEISDLELILKNAKSFTSLLIESQLKLIDLYLNEECYPDTYLFEAIEELSNRKLKFTDEERSRGCKKLDKETYEKIKGFMKAYMSLSRIFVESERNDTDNAGNLLMLSLSITTKQIWLEILLNSDESFRDLNEILQISSEIIRLTRTKFFPYLQINATKGIILAATLRASYYYKLGPNENVNDDLRALKSLSTKYKYIQTECVDLMKALETLTYMSLNSGSLSNPFSVDEICNFTSKIEPTTLKAPTEGGIIVYYNDYVENHRPNLNQVMKEDTDLIDELVNCLLDQDKIKKEVTDPIQQKESLHYRKLQLVQTYRNKATDRQDNYQVIEMMKNIRLFYMLQ
ncbi:predicted protein [Naegleria gruberi]|uniref:Predicted protein n=1 Tax=Naegleria gruberi TaxID=5762 RepID=D2VUV5_NAEGR|nr:uncharacterized protein NAEGRDRAFT_52435 [Naegleria gruberi]EFC39331.1 predicted protein [Naegleria gruberi]|eukprot:XP_002672075.1 predicted protein [Naegleria gruberi strain NEG-M]